MKLNSKEIKSFISLKLRYFIKNNINFDQILLNYNLMKRDYWQWIDYYKDDIKKYKQIMATRGCYVIFTDSRCSVPYHG